MFNIKKYAAKLRPAQSAGRRIYGAGADLNESADLLADQKAAEPRGIYPPKFLNKNLGGQAQNNAENNIEEGDSVDVRPGWPASNASPARKASLGDAGGRSDAGWVWEAITKWCLYFLIFLTPLFFLPWGILPVAQNKQFLATVLIGVALIAWLAKTIASGKIVYAKSPLNIAMWILVAAWGMAAYFSISRLKSLGFLGADPDSLLSILNYVLAFFLVAATFGKEPRLPAGRQGSDADLKMRRGLHADIQKAIYVLLASVAVLAIFIGLKFLNINFLPHLFGGQAWDFAKTADFNPVGTINGLALFLGFGLVLAVSLLTVRRSDADMKDSADQTPNNPPTGGPTGQARIKKFLPIGLIFLAVVLGIELLIINFKAVWWALAGAMLLLVAFGFVKETQEIKAGKKEVFKMQTLAAPIVILIASVILLLVNLPLGNLVNFSAEVSPSFSATYDIAKNVLSSGGLKTEIFGSGPGTFVYDYGLYRSEVLNQTLFWGVRFPQGFSFVLTSLATAGLLGIASLLCLLLAFIWQVIRGSNADLRIGRGSHPEGVRLGGPYGAGADYLSVVLACAALFLFIAWFLYPLNFTLLMFSFIGLGLLSASQRGSIADQNFSADQPRIREISLLASPQRTLVISLILIVLMVGAVSLLYLESQKYIASLYFSSAINTFNRTGDPDVALDKIAKAVNLDSSADSYWRAGSQVFLMKTNQILNSPDWQGAAAAALEDLRSQFQVNMSQAISFAQRATQEVPNESLNWTNLGYVYENILSFVTGGEKFLVESYQKAAVLEPKNPALQADLGRAHLVIADKIQAQINQLSSAQKPDQAQIDALAQQWNQELETSIRELDKALGLKPDYSPTHFLMAQVYTRQGDIKKAIVRSQDYYILNSQDAGAAFQLGFLFYKDNQLENAKAALQRAVELNNDYSNARYFLGLIYDNQGNKQAAIEQFEKIAVLNSDNSEVVKILDNLRNNRAALAEIVPPAQPPAERTETPVEEAGGAPAQPIRP